ncbi:ABC transporter A family member 12 [Galdieria sulphuraria]|uniref:Probable ATP-dependent transporter ycf16 n=1 Tax=Galdieria sulphuraria TaxID=130081 RepID=M2XUE0_GALSU|nr:ABC-2 type transport system, ATP-binding protein [Galdieria sulphuraria]EME27268.1 ABC-2 type transport system, ATP-binding protein [Galdieria sulphuraria]GJD11326.1 ABC transporter A family member 12 [Galdieria sulphuraria]|eukprot:XP_005703788.1 ABC-2 type transport system, ATP-binding protein [Galdieria sulphuraria]
MLEQSLPCIPVVNKENSTCNAAQGSEETSKAAYTGETQKHRRVVTWGGEGPVSGQFRFYGAPEGYGVNNNDRNQKRNSVVFYFNQVEALFLKSFHFQRRQKVELLLNILAPLIILAVLYGISKLADSVMHDTAVKYEAKNMGYFIPQFRNPYYVGTNNEFLVSQPGQGESAGSISYPACSIFSNPSQCALLATENNGQPNVKTSGILSEFTLQPFVGDNPKQFLVYGNFSQFRGNTSEMLKYLSYYEAAELYGHNLIDYALSVHTSDKESNGTVRSSKSGRQDIIQTLMSDNPGSLGFDSNYYAAFAFSYINTNLGNNSSPSRFTDSNSLSSFWKRTSQGVLSTIGFVVDVFYNAVLTETMDYYEYNSCTRGNCQLVASVMRLSDAFYRYTFGRSSSSGILSQKEGTIRAALPSNLSITDLLSSLNHLNYSSPNVSNLLLGSNLTQSERYRLTNRLPYHVANLLMPMENGVPAIKNFLDIYGMIAIALLLHFLIPSYMRTLVYERTSGLRVLMKMMGLQTGVYWLVTYIFMLFMFILFSAIIILLGLAFRITFFSENYPLTYIGLFFVWGNTCIAFSMFLSSLMRNPSQALMLGWTYVIVVNFMGFLYITKLVKYHASESLMNWTSILPSFAFLRALYYIGKANEAGFAVSLSGATGMCRKPMPCCIVMEFLVVEWILFLLLGIYIDMVFPQQGYRKHPLFFLGFPWFKSTSQSLTLQGLKSWTTFCWPRTGTHSPEGSTDLPISSYDNTISGLDSPRKFVSKDDVVLDIDEMGGGTPTTKSRVSFPLDVIEEQRTCYRGILNEKPGVYLFHLRKEYDTGKLFSKKRVHVALKDLSFSIPIGSCVGMLGRNGAGKTTTVSIMSGLFPPTSGQAFLGGYSVWKDMQQINLLTGVCPQHSILWDDLTAEEHLYFYAKLKGGGSNIKKRVDSLLESVGLHSSKSQLVGKFSGGMKRRLSVAIAFAGDPEIVFLDEPSTGLDPLSKHALWKFIEEQKPGRAILLTTHAMDEAERLCDKIGLVSHGSLLCVGDPESLKNRLGMGYRIEVTIDSKRHDQSAAIAKDMLLRLNGVFKEKVELNRNINGHLIYNIPRSVVLLSRVFEEVAKLTKDFPIRDWAVSSSTLEDVFVRVVSNDKGDFFDDIQENPSYSPKHFRGLRQRTVSSPIA